MINRKTITKLFEFHKLGLVQTIEKITVGFTNELYTINENYILKVCKDKSNEERFEKESFFYTYFKNKIPIPELKIYDSSKKLINYDYIIYPKIEGKNLYAVWHLLEEVDRKKIVKKICETLKVINKSEIEAVSKRYNLNPEFSWKNKIVKKIEESLRRIEEENILNKKAIKSIKEFVRANKHVLNEQEIRIVYWDIHFDNVIVEEKEVVGLLDFERTELCSLDYVLDIVKRMVEYPRKYASSESEKFIKPQDYKNLLIWYEEFYPELFDFKHLNKRLDFYSIEQNLATLLHWPNDHNLKKIIEKIIDTQ